MKVDQKRRWKMFVVAGATMALVAGMVSTVPSAYAGGTIKNADNPDQYISLGMGIRTSFTSGEDRSASGGQWDNTFAVDNSRVYINGGIHKYVKFTFNTECFNCSVNAGAGFNGNSNIGLIDAIGKFEITRTINFWVGRTLVPTERGELNGPFYHQVYDGFRTPFNQSDISPGFGSSSAPFGGAGAFGRDQGIVFFGKVDPAGTHLLYAFMVSTGLQSPGGPLNTTSVTIPTCAVPTDPTCAVSGLPVTVTAFSGGGPNQRSTLKYSGRLQWNLLADEMANNPGYYTAGGYYGDYGDVLALAVSGEYQNQGVGSFAHPSPYKTFIGDILYEKVLSDKGVFTANAEYKRYWTQSLAAYGDPDCFCMFNGTSVTAYALYLFPQEIGIGKFQPYGRYTYVNSVYASHLDEFEAGVNYVISGFNARMSAYWRNGNLASGGGPATTTHFTGLSQTGQHRDSFVLALQLQY
ncbi:MAG: hypothetical protein ACREIJ_08145 [Nitrospiraceae bacterium]